jgi:hypothetical protein
MAQTYFPFDSGSGGSVTESQWGQMAQFWLSTGVLKGQLNQLNVFADSTGMQVKIDTGMAWVQGYYYKNDALVTLAIAAANATNPRIDRVVVRVDWTANTIQLAIIQGIPAASPTAPAVTQNNSIWEISLAQVLVGANVSTIAAGNITDERTLMKNANDKSTSWVNLTLQNGWSATANGLTTATTPQYRKNLFGELELRGLMGGGTIAQGTVIATLPVGFRPVQETRLIVAKHDGGGFAPGLMYIYPTGEIQSIVLSNYFVSLGNIPPIDCA